MLIICLPQLSITLGSLDDDALLGITGDDKTSKATPTLQHSLSNDDLLAEDSR